MSKTTLKYYSFNKIFSYGATFNFIIGARGLGKTFGAKKFVIRNFLRSGEQFIYLRRYKTELAKRSTFFADIAEEFPNYDFRVNGNEAQIATASTRDKDKRDWKTMGYFSTLSTAQTEKSVAYPLVTIIIFDEFIIEKGYIRYLPAEVKAFQEFYSTVDRWKDKTRVLFLANSVSMTNPYFLEWNIRPDEVGEYSSSHGNFIACHFAESKEFATAVYETAFGKFIKDSEYADYSIESKFRDAHQRMIGQKPSAAKLHSIIETSLGRFSVWIDHTIMRYYIQERCPDDCLVFTLIPEEMDNGKIYLKYNDGIMGVLRTAFRHALVTFDTPKSRNIFIEVFRR